MEDLRYIVTLGFSGSDVVRAVILAFLFAMMTARQSDVWRMAAFAFIIDRFIWPIAGMALSGSDIHAIYASIGAFFTSFLDDLGIYVVRYLGLCLMMSVFIALRRRIHHVKQEKSAAKPAYPY